MGDIQAASQTQTPRHLTQDDLASRWRISGRTLERWRWRWQRLGPNYVKVGGRVVYRLTDVLTYEAAQLHATVQTNDPFFRKAR
jgi:hypothetical protein